MLGPTVGLISRDATPLNPPDAPTALQVAQASTNQAQIRWEHSGVDTFEIDRSADGGAFSQIDTAGGGVRKYTDSGPLSNGVDYTYRIRATNAQNGDSENSETVSVTIDTGDEFPDDSPEDLVASVTDGVDGQGEVTLSWTDTVSNEDSFIPVRNGVQSVFDSVGSGVETKQITGLSDEQESDWEVEGLVTGVGVSIRSNKRSQFTRLAAPSNVNITSTGSGNQFWRITWTNNSSLHQNVKLFNDGALFATLPPGTEQHDVAKSQEPTFVPSVQAVASGIPDSIEVGL